MFFLRQFSDIFVGKINIVGIFFYIIHIICLFVMFITLYQKDDNYVYKYQSINTYISNKYKIKSDKTSLLIRILYSTNIILAIISIFVYTNVILKHYKKKDNE